MTDLEEKKFYEYLASFQDDIVRLVAYRRKSHHLMSVEEIVSDFNYNTIRKKEKIIGYRDERFKEFSFESFKFVVCSHIKNIINWYQCRKVEEKYHSRRVNHEIKTEEGVKTSFEVISETQGEDFDYSFLTDEDMIFISVDVVQNKIYEQIVKTSRAQIYSCAPYKSSYLNGIFT